MEKKQYITQTWGKDFFLVTNWDHEMKEEN